MAYNALCHSLQGNLNNEERSISMKLCTFDKNCSLELEKQLIKDPYYNQLAKGSTKVTEHPTQFDEFFVRELYLPELRLKELEVLGLVSWHIDETLGWYIRIAMEKQLKKFQTRDLIVVRLLLSSKNNAFNYIYQSNYFKPRRIFGNDLKRVLRIFRFIKFYRVDTRPVKEQLRIGVGYNDKGSLRISDHETGPDIELLVRDQQLKDEQKSLSDTTELLEGFLGG